MIPQLPKLFLILIALFAFVSSQIAEGNKFECYLDNQNQTRVCANRQNLCVRASKCRQNEDEPSHFRGQCAWNEMQAIYFCTDILKSHECDSCKICNTSKCNDDERFMKELAHADESHEIKPTSIELSSTESNPSKAEGFQCYIQRGMEPIFCPNPYCFGGIDCSKSFLGAGTVHYHFLGSCVENKKQGEMICKDFGCANCTTCQGNKCNSESFLRDGNDENNETKLSTSTELSSTESNPSSSEFISTVTSSMPPSTPSGAISAFSNGPKWESFIALAILTASAILLTAAIF